MTELSIVPRLIKQVLSNGVLNYDIITCINGNQDIKNGQSFDILAVENDALIIMVGDKRIAVHHSTMACERCVPIAYFKPRVIIDSIDTLVVHDVGLVAVGESHNDGGSKDLSIKDAVITIDEIDIKISFDGHILDAGRKTHHHKQIVMTNIIGIHPLFEIKPDVEQKILDAIMGKYHHSVLNKANKPHTIG